MATKMKSYAPCLTSLSLSVLLMGLNDIPHPAFLSRKRCRSDDPSSPADPAPQHKQSCFASPSAPHSHSHHLTYLEELESSLDTSTLESPTPEDLVTEMMQSLEKVIGHIEDLSSVSETLDDATLISEADPLDTLPEVRLKVPEVLLGDSEALDAVFASDTSDPEPSVCCDPDLELVGVRNLPELVNGSSCSHGYSSERDSEAGEGSNAGVDLRHLLEMSDDELGIPAANSAGNPENEVSAHVSDDDWSLLDESCSDSAGVNNTSRDGGVYAHLMMGGWFDNDCDFVHGEDSLLELTREHGGVILLDGYM